MKAIHLFALVSCKIVTSRIQLVEKLPFSLPSNDAIYSSCRVNTTSWCPCLPRDVWLPTHLHKSVSSGLRFQVCQVYEPLFLPCKASKPELLLVMATALPVYGHSSFWLCIISMTMISKVLNDYNDIQTLNFRVITIQSIYVDLCGWTGWGVLWQSSRLSSGLFVL